MLPWRLQLREAREALRIGQLDQATELVRRHELDQYQGGRRLSVELATEILRRAQQQAALGNSAAAWSDLGTAGRLGANAAEAAALGELLTRQALAEAERYLSADDPQAARRRLERLGDPTAAAGAVRTLRLVIEHVLHARQSAQRGQFAQAETLLAATVALRPDLTWLEDRRARYRLHLEEARELLAGMHQALATQQWPEVLRLADRLLEIAPQCEPARSARRKAWNSVSVTLASSLAAGGRRRLPDQPLANRMSPACAEVDALSSASRTSRFLLWIDSVGGYLVCPANEVLIGQPGAGGEVDVPILADLSRRHARIRREGEGYLIEPLRPLQLDGRQVFKTEPLTDGQTIELGQGVELRFRRPHPLSATARLDFLSHHRTPSSVDGVILMADTCVLADRPTAHIICRHWRDEVVLFQRPGGLGCRAKVSLEVDGVAAGQKCELDYHSRVAGDDFSFSVEAVE